jgi:hypothetical protein
MLIQFFVFRKVQTYCNVIPGRNIDEELSQLQVLHIEALNDLEKTRNLLRLMIIKYWNFLQYMFRARDTVEITKNKKPLAML